MFVGMWRVSVFWVCDRVLGVVSRTDGIVNALCVPTFCMRMDAFVGMHSRKIAHAITLLISLI